MVGGGGIRRNRGAGRPVGVGGRHVAEAGDVNGDGFTGDGGAVTRDRRVVRVGGDGVAQSPCGCEDARRGQVHVDCHSIGRDAVIDHLDLGETQLRGVRHHDGDLIRADREDRRGPVVDHDLDSVEGRVERIVIVRQRVGGQVASVKSDQFAAGDARREGGGTGRADHSRRIQVDSVSRERRRLHPHVDSQKWRQTKPDSDRAARADDVLIEGKRVSVSAVGIRCVVVVVGVIGRSGEVGIDALVSDDGAAV